MVVTNLRTGIQEAGEPRLQAGTHDVRAQAYHGGMTSPTAVAELLLAPVATAEFLVVDTETNGLAGDACEMTEVGAVLVGGGELHERFSTLCRTSAPLQRGIQRFTGITQAMVDSAPSLEDVLPPLAERLAGRILVAHNAPFDRRVLRQAFRPDRPGVAEPACDLYGGGGAEVAAAAAQARARRARGRARDRGRARAPGAGGR